MRKLVILLAGYSLIITSTASAAPAAPTIEVTQQGEISRLIQVRNTAKRRRKGTLIVTRAASARSPYLPILEYQLPIQTIRFTEVAKSGGGELYRARIKRRIRSTNWSEPASAKPAKIVLNNFHQFSKDLDYILPIGVKLCTKQLSNELFIATNEIRRNQGLTTLRRDLYLDQAARNHSIFMAQAKDMTHDGWLVRVFETGFSGYYVAQNIAKYISDPKKLVTAWSNSPGHRENQFNTKGSLIGVACAYDSSGMIYWSQIFGGNL